MSQNWQQKLDITLRGIQDDLGVIGRDLSRFTASLNVIEQALIGCIVMLMLFYLLLRPSEDKVSGMRNFVGMLLLVGLVGLGGGLLASGRIYI